MQDPHYIFTHCLHSLTSFWLLLLLWGRTVCSTWYAVWTKQCRETVVILLYHSANIDIHKKNLNKSQIFCMPNTFCALAFFLRCHGSKNSYQSSLWKILRLATGLWLTLGKCVHTDCRPHSVSLHLMSHIIIWDPSFLKVPLTLLLCAV